MRRRRPGHRARPARAARRSPIRTSGTPTATTTPTTPLGTPCFGYYATTPGPIAPGSTTECPRLFPELYTGGVGPHGAAKYHYDAGQPEHRRSSRPTTTTRSSSASSRRTRCARSSSTRRTACSRSTASWTAAQANVANPAFAVRVRQPDGHAVRRRRLVLPADLRRRVLRHQPGRRHVPLGLRQGPARAEGRADDRPDRRRRCR